MNNPSLERLCNVHHKGHPELTGRLPAISPGRPSKPVHVFTENSHLLIPCLAFGMPLEFDTWRRGKILTIHRPSSTHNR